MMVANRGSVLRLVRWQWRSVLVLTLIAGVVVELRLRLAPTFALPPLPAAIIGGAVGIFVSFRTNSAYARWWEGRQLWGRLVNVSRMFASQVLAYLPEDDEGRETARRIVRRHIAYVHALRAALRLEAVHDDARVRAMLDEREALSLASETNPAHAIVHETLTELARAHRARRIDGDQLRVLDESVRTMLDVQGGCERIKKTPLPRGYAFIAERLIWGMAALIPLVMPPDLSHLATPVTVLVCLAFTMISEAGRVLEDPFTHFWNGLPLTQLSTMIEANLRQRLGDEDLPKIPQVDADGILM